MLSHQALPQNVEAIRRPSIVTGSTGLPFLRSFWTSRVALRRRSAADT